MIILKENILLNHADFFIISVDENEIRKYAVISKSANRVFCSKHIFFNINNDEDPIEKGLTVAKQNNLF